MAKSGAVRGVLRAREGEEEEEGRLARETALVTAQRSAYETDIRVSASVACVRGHVEVTCCDQPDRSLDSVL